MGGVRTMAYIRSEQLEQIIFVEISSIFHNTTSVYAPCEKQRCVAVETEN